MYIRVLETTVRRQLTHLIHLRLAVLNFIKFYNIYTFTHLNLIINIRIFLICVQMHYIYMYIGGLT